MIHSMSGGVIKEKGLYTFLKVEVDGAPYWYLSPKRAEAGQRVLVPFGKGDLPREGVVLKAEEAEACCAPYPMNRIREIYEIL